MVAAVGVGGWLTGGIDVVDDGAGVDEPAGCAEASAPGLPLGDASGEEAAGVGDGERGPGGNVIVPIPFGPTTTPPDGLAGSGARPPRISAGVGGEAAGLGVQRSPSSVGTVTG